jgi:Flp pilus assembly protein TadG
MPVTTSSATIDRPARTRRLRALRREDGQALTEFALVLPLLLVLIMGIIQFGFVFKDYIAVTDATRVGARQAAVSRTLADPAEKTKDKVKQAAVGLDTSRLDIKVSPWDPITSSAIWATGGDVTVHVTYPYKVKLFGIGVMDLKLQSRTTERIE